MTDDRAKWLVSPEALAAELGSDRLRLYDTTCSLRAASGGVEVVPGREAYLQSHLPGAAYLDHELDLSVPDSPLRFTHKSAADLAATFAGAGIGAEEQVVFYSAGHSMWATRAWWLLRFCGHDAVRVLDGGLSAWIAAGLPVDSGPATYPVAELTPVERPALFASEAEVSSAIGAGDVCTINALPAAVYEGTSPINYGRPGHIKGSLSLPYDELTPEGRFASLEQLEASLEARGLLQRQRVISYCGGGIAATTVAFALSLLGQDNVAVYDGSLQEWNATATNPLVIGTDPG